jgi:FkbM family methyltransferase
VRLAWGSPLKINVDELIGATIWHRGVHDLAASEAVSRIVNRGDVAVDVGANIGYMTSLMVARAGSTGRVHAFEPHPLIFRTLQTNVALAVDGKEGPEIRLHNTALGESAGKASLNLPAEWAANHGLATLGDFPSSTDSLAVDVERFDDAVDETRIALLKLDVEGHEAAVLNGARDALAAGRIRNIVYEDHHPDDSAVGKILKDYGYSIFSLGFSTSGFISDRIPDKADKEPASSDFLATLDPAAWETLAAVRGWSLFSKSQDREGEFAAR